MKNFAIIFCLFFFSSLAINGQNSDQIIAKANGFSFTLSDLNPIELRKSFEQMNSAIADKRKIALEEVIGEMLIEKEANSRKILADNLLNIEVYRKVLNPTEIQIKALFEENKAQLGNTKLEEIRGRLVKFLRQQSEQKALLAYIARLKTKYKPVYIVDVNSLKLKPTDTLATINTTQILASKFEEKMNLSLFDFKMTLYEQAKNSIEQTAYAKFVIAEATTQNISSEDYLRREISDKMVEYTDPERNRLQAFVQDKLFQKYKFEFLLKQPVAPVQKIDTTNAFSKGNQNARVTIVMFTDFQCPSCSAIHPILQEVMNEYGENIRFVVRNFPLVTLHNNAFKAAQAAQAARTQGKFLEYIDILYKNQEKLDVVSLKKYASDLKLDRKQFDLELDSKKYEEIVKKDLADGIFYGVGSTPTVFINGVKLRELSAESFKNAIENGLK